MATRYRARSAPRRMRSLTSMIGIAVIITGMLGLPAATPLSAHPARAHLPILRLDGDGPGNQLEIPAYSTFLAVNAGLVQILPNDRVAGDLATYTVSKNQRVYTFTIRPNARFSNGHFVTAHDAEFSLKRVLGVANPGGSVMTVFGPLIQGAGAFYMGKTKRLSGVTVLGRRVLRITIVKPAAYFLGTLSLFSTVYDPAVIAGKPVGSYPDYKNDYRSTTCIGNQGAGPFMFACHNRSSTPHSFYSGHTPMYTLVPNPYYYGPKPRIGIEMRNIRNDYKAYLAGTVDETGNGLPLPFLRRWRGSKEYRAYPSSEVTFIQTNTHLAPFNNLHCRRAAAYALDRKTITDRVLNGAQRATYDLVARGMLGYYAGNDNPHYNLRRARAEFAQCPSRTAPVELKTFGDDAASRNEGIAAVRNLATAGFNITLKVLSQNDWYAIVSQPFDKSRTQLIFSGWIQDYPDPQDYCSLLRSGGPDNTEEWSNTTYDHLVDRADAILNPKQRAALYIRAQHILFSQGALISLGNVINFALVKPYVHGLVFTEAYQWPQPKDGNWANVWISPH